MKARKVGLMFAIGVSFLFSNALCAQQVRQSPGQDSELTKENLGRVGASPNQIQASAPPTAGTPGRTETLGRAGSRFQRTDRQRLPT